MLLCKLYIPTCQSGDPESRLPGAAREWGTWSGCRHPASRIPKLFFSSFLFPPFSVRACVCVCVFFWYPLRHFVSLSALAIKPIHTLPQLLWLGLLRLDAPAMLAVSSLLQERQGSKWIGQDSESELELPRQTLSLRPAHGMPLVWGRTMEHTAATAPDSRILLIFP